MDNSRKASAFAALHVPGVPFVLYNIWDAGSARAVASAGAKAIATGSASVAAANGLDDGEDVPLALALDNARRIVAAVERPVTIDFEGGYAVEPDEVALNMTKLVETGAVGCNFEDQVVGGSGVHPVEVQCERIKAVRTVVGDAFFINARTDLFLQSKPENHESLIDDAIERARAYADAGASGFFVPLLADLKLVERVCRESPLPVNAMHFPGAPTREQWASAGIARISHGPFPHRALMKQLEEAAREALASVNG
jgi:2-methylisocitrate lyase-like PEP mutase family enzyme